MIKEQEKMNVTVNEDTKTTCLTMKEVKPQLLVGENDPNRLTEDYFKRTQMTNVEQEKFMMECSSSLANSRSMSSELKEAGFFKRIWNNITGKNRKMRDAVNDNLNDALYAQQQMIVELSKRQSTGMAIVANVNKHMHELYIEINEELAINKKGITKLCDEVTKRVVLLEKKTTVHEERLDVLEDYAYLCGSCKKPVLMENIVCPFCGHIFSKKLKSFKNISANEYYRENINFISDEVVNIKKVGVKEYRHKREAYIDKVVSLKDLIKKLRIDKATSAALNEQCNLFVQNAEKSYVDIAIVGTVKAGKSMLINALLDADIAPVDENPETSCLTKFVSSKTNKFSFKLFFYTKIEWDKLWDEVSTSSKGTEYKINSSFLKEFTAISAEKIMDEWIERDYLFKEFDDLETMKIELKKYIGSKSPIHFFVREAVITINTISLPSDVCLVDTPGLNDISARSDLTIKYLSSADAVIACTQLKNLSDTRGVEFVQRVLRDRKEERSVYVVATQMDVVTPDVYQSMTNKYLNSYMIPLFSSHNKNNSNKNIYKNLFFGVSAKMYSMAKAYENHNFSIGTPEYNTQFLPMLLTLGYSIKSDYLEDLTDIKEKSGIIKLRRSIINSLINNARKENLEKLEKNYQFLKGNVEIICRVQIEAIDSTIVTLENEEIDFENEKEECEKSQLQITNIIRTVAKLKSEIK